MLVLDGEKIDKIMKDRKITQCKLSDLSGVDGGLIRQIRDGKAIRPKTAGKVAKALGMSVRDLAVKVPPKDYVVFDRFELDLALADRLLTYEGLAKKMWFSDMVLSKIAAGARCRIETAEMIADALEVPLEKLIREG